jgi:hypothetical protein
MTHALLALAFASAASPVAPQAFPEIEQQIVPMVDCVTSRGSAVRIGPNLLVTARHVVKDNPERCSINGKPFKVIYNSPTNDFSMLWTDEPGPFREKDCGGFVKGRTYTATGHARGLPELTSINLISTGAWNAGFGILWGIFTVIPGQSGGEITDDATGKVVGIINFYDPQKGLSGSVQMKDMPICKEAA